LRSVVINGDSEFSHYSCLQADLWLKLIGLVQRLAKLGAVLQGGPKNGAIFVHLIISPNINRFSKFFHCQISGDNL